MCQVEEGVSIRSFLDTVPNFYFLKFSDRRNEMLHTHFKQYTVLQVPSSQRCFLFLIREETNREKLNRTKNMNQSFIFVQPFLHLFLCVLFVRILGEGQRGYDVCRCELHEVKRKLVQRESFDVWCLLPPTLFFI